MKSFILAHILPVVIAIIVVIKLSTYTEVNRALFKNYANTDPVTKIYVDRFDSNSIFYQNWFLESAEKTDAIFIMGSSELTSKYPALPHNFINKHFSTKVYSLGHAGNQCFSIYTQLLANTNKLNGAPIVIILSPLWFVNQFAKGTNPDVFLQFNSEKYLNNIIQNDSMQIERAYAKQQILKYNTSFASPPLSFKVFKAEEISEKNIFYKIYYSPVVFAYKTFLKFKLITTNHEFILLKNKPYRRKNILTDSVYINWDSLFSSSKNLTLKQASNNTWSVNNAYYSKFINGKRTSFEIEKAENIQELKDFKMLLKLLHQQKVNASFVIFPMNPYYYINLKEVTPLVNQLNIEIKKSGFKCLNMWISDTVEFEKGTLSDVMHPSNYSWYKADKFIIDTYKLNKMK